MWLTEVAIRRRVFIGMVVLALIVLGARGLKDMPWDLYPDIEFPVATVVTVYPGAGPEEIEDRIARPLEDAVSTISGVDTVTSVCQQNMGATTVRFEYGIDIDVAAADVRDATERARSQFPDDAEAPSIYKIDVKAMPIISMGISGDRPETELKEIVEDRIEDRLNKVKGVASVSTYGAVEREIHVLADRGRLDAVGLSCIQLSKMIAAENVDVPLGSIREGRIDYAVRSLSKFQRPDEIREVWVNTPLGGLVQLGDIAEVKDTIEDRDTISRVNRKASIGLSVTKQSGANTVKVAHDVKNAVKQLDKELPDDIQMVISWDASEAVIEAISDVFIALLWGALLASTVVFLFLHNLRGTFIVALAIPTSIMATFLPISAMGMTLNMMVMMALSLSVGILVDDSIVVLENIERHLQMGEEPAAAALNGRSEIGLAAIAITSVDIVVFIPVAFMGGIVGQFFKAFGITVAIATAFSLFISFTLTPMLASWWYPRIDIHKRAAGRATFARRFFAALDGPYGWLERAYRGVLARVTGPRSRFVTIGLGVGALGVAVFFLFPNLGFTFMPTTDQGRLAVQVEMSPGTRLEETDRVLRQVEAVVSDAQRYPEVEDFQATVGSIGGGGFGGVGYSGGQYANCSVTLVKKRERTRSDRDVVRQLREDLAFIPSATIRVVVEGGEGGGGAGIELQLLGPDLDELEQVADVVIPAVSGIEGLRYVERSSKPGRPELHIRVDRERAADHGFTAGEVAMAVRAGIEGDTSTKYTEGGKDYDIRVRLAEADRDNAGDVRSIFLGLTRQAQALRVGDVARVVQSSGPTRIERESRMRKVTVSAYLQEGIPLSDIQLEIEEMVKPLVPKGMTWQWGGEVRIMGESFRYIAEALILALLLVFMVTAALYNAILEPFNVWFTVPMAMVGAALALWMFGHAMSIVAMIGMIMLMGLVGKNAILMVDYINTLRARGVTRREAILTAGPTRMKPILMTTTATIMGMLPTALAMAEGSEMRQPMAIAVIGGLAFSMVLSLLMVPSMYTVIDDVAWFLMRVWYRVYLKMEPDPEMRWKRKI